MSSIKDTKAAFRDISDRLVAVADHLDEQCGYLVNEYDQGILRAYAETMYMWAREYDLLARTDG